MPVEQLLPLLFSGLTVILTIAILSTLTKIKAAVEELAARPVVAPAPQPVDDGTDEIYAVIMATISEDLQIPLDQLQFNSIREY